MDRIGDRASQWPHRRQAVTHNPPRRGKLPIQAQHGIRGARPAGGAVQGQNGAPCRRKVRKGGAAASSCSGCVRMRTRPPGQPHRRPQLRPTDSYVAKRGRRLRHDDPTQRNDRLLPLRGQKRPRYPLTCTFGARGRIRTDDLPITMSKRTRPAGASQARSGCSRRRGRPASAVLTCRVTAGGMTKRMTGPT